MRVLVVPCGRPSCLTSLLEAALLQVGYIAGMLSMSLCNVTHNGVALSAKLFPKHCRS